MPKQFSAVKLAFNLKHGASKKVFCLGFKEGKATQGGRDSGILTLRNPENNSFDPVIASTVN